MSINKNVNNYQIFNWSVISEILQQINGNTKQNLPPINFFKYFL